MTTLRDAAENATAGVPVVRLADCPTGMFISESGTLCLKTEYGNNEGRIDAYIVSSGEFFWGAPPQTIASQRAQLVQPVEVVPLSELDTARAEIERLRAALAFYRDGFTFITDKRRPGLAWVPTETLLDDCGNIARATLSPAVKEPK